ncbi:MAG: antigen, partial [Verrucomicrobia bacterium]|nr:antigen [Verrucomicrobiota bacterium]
RTERPFEGDRQTQNERQSAKERSQERRTDRLNGAAKASDLIGMTVKNYQDDKLGKVEELAVDVESGRVVQVILSVGGIAGIGDRQIAVPPSALHHDVAQKVVHLDSTKDRLKAAPKFEMSKWNEYSATNHLRTVYGYYGEEPALTFIENDRAERNEAPDTISVRRPDGTWENRTERQARTMIPSSRLAQVQKASKVIGMSVKNKQDEKLGDVNNLLVDLTSGRIVAVVVSSGGFIGLGDDLSAVPSSALSYNADRNALQLDATKDMLSRAPHFKSNQWPDFSEPTYAHSVYRAYNVEPYFTTNGLSRTESVVRNDIDRTARDAERAARDAERTVRDNDRPLKTTDVDNTARNERDRNDATLTPVDQGTSKADIDTTAQIRKEIIATKSLSLKAQNVKVISNNGKVTLRGPVDTAEEKKMIGDIANRIARSENVSNQLEVKLTPTGRSQDGRK